MRLATSGRRHAMRMAAAQAHRPTRSARVIKALRDTLSAISGGRRRAIERARIRFELLDIDQRVREVGEW